MTDPEVDRMIRQIQEMARRIGCEFVPDARKLEVFRDAQRWQRQ